MPKHFIRVKENFICNHCHTKIKGTGYTNHCPHCLHSKHVDLHTPGDRASSCQGFMKPIASQLKKDQFILIHQYLKCQKISRCKTQPNDNQKLLIKLSTKPTIL